MLRRPEQLGPCVKGRASTRFKAVCPQSTRGTSLQVDRPRVAAIERGALTVNDGEEDLLPRREALVAIAPAYPYPVEPDFGLHKPLSGRRWGGR